MSDKANHYNCGAILDSNENMRKQKLYKKALKVWGSMLQRCSDEKLHQVEETYSDCTVCEEWKLFSNFYKWFCENYYKIPTESIQLDKDILIKGNKLYSPETCCFVPHTINSLFTKSNKNRGNTPIGVSWITRDRVYRAQCNDGHKHRVGLGDYHTPEEAFNAYKTFKETVIKEIANEYKEIIPKSVYDAMLKYEVEITD